MGGGALAGAAALVAFGDPAAAGSRFPNCMFHQVTGLWCPACGLTRGTHELLNGHIVAALGSNLFTPLVLLAIAATWVAWARRSFGRAPTNLAVTLGSLRDRTWRWSGPALLVVALAYCVLRGTNLRACSVFFFISHEKIFFIVFNVYVRGPLLHLKLLGVVVGLFLFAVSSVVHHRSHE